MSQLRAENKTRTFSHAKHYRSHPSRRAADLHPAPSFGASCASVPRDEPEKPAGVEMDLKPQKPGNVDSVLLASTAVFPSGLDLTMNSDTLAAVMYSVCLNVQFTSTESRRQMSLISARRLQIYADSGKHISAISGGQDPKNWGCALKSH